MKKLSKFQSTLKIKAIKMQIQQSRSQDLARWAESALSHFFLRRKKRRAVQGPPYILARYETAIFSKSVDNFPKLFFTKQCCGSSECSYQMIFLICLCCLLLQLQSYSSQQPINIIHQTFKTYLVSNILRKIASDKSTDQISSLVFCLRLLPRPSKSIKITAKGV